MRCVLVLLLLANCKCTHERASVPSCADVDCVPGRIACGFMTDAGTFDRPELCDCETRDGSVVRCHN